MSTPPNASTTRRRPRDTEAASVTSHAHRQRRAAEVLALSPRPRLVEIEQGNLGSGRRERLGGRAADGAAGAGDDGDLAGERLSAAALSFACSSDQYSMSNISASEIDSKRPMASASAMTSTAHCARSAAILASFFDRPRPNRPRPGTSATRGSGSSAFLMPPTRAFWRAESSPRSARRTPSPPRARRA